MTGILRTLTAIPSSDAEELERWELDVLAPVLGEIASEIGATISTVRAAEARWASLGRPSASEACDLLTVSLYDALEAIEKARKEVEA